MTNFEQILRHLRTADSELLHAANLAEEKEVNALESEIVSVGVKLSSVISKVEKCVDAERKDAETAKKYEQTH